MPRRAYNARTEHAARLAPPGEFRERSFRRKRIAPGVALVIGKRPGATATEAQSVRFDAQKFTPTQAREWLARYGYTPIGFDAANPSGAASSPANPPKTWEAFRTHVERSLGRATRLEADAADIRTQLGRVLRVGIPTEEDRALANAEIAASSAVDNATFLDESIRELRRELVGNPPAPSNPENADASNPVPGDPFVLRAMVREAHRRRMHGASWYTRSGTPMFTTGPAGEPAAEFKRRHTAYLERVGGKLNRWHLYRGNPENEADDGDDLEAYRFPPLLGPNAHAAVATAIAVAPDVPPAPNPRTLDQLGQARQLDVTIAGGDGAVRRYRWSIRDDWRVLTPAGAEHLPAGSGRLFLVPPPPASASVEPAPKDGAGVATFVEWHQFEPREAISTDVPGVSDFAARLGTAIGIVYRSDKWQPGDPLDYEHPFKPSEPPEVWIIGTAEAPRAVLVRGGAFRVTARGLVD